MTIGQRISALIVLTVAVCMVVFGAYNVRARREEIFGEAVVDAAEVGATLDVVLNDLLEHRELKDLEALPDEISRAERIYGLAVFDLATGDVISSRSVANEREQFRLLAAEALRSGRPSSHDLWLHGDHVAAYAFPLRRGRHDVVGAGVVLRDLAYMEGQLRAALRRIVGVGVLLAALVVLVVQVVTRRAITAPVAMLIDGVRRTGEGDLTHPIPVQRHDELGRIAAALNQLMQDLTGAREQIRRDLESRIQLEKSVEFERRLQHAQRLAAVGQIAASLAHEIGSPLHVVAGRARFAAGRDDAKEMRDNLLVIAEQADRITRVVNQLLSVARRRAPKFEPVPPARVARDVVSLLGPQARQQNVTLELLASDEDLTVQGDADSLQQVIFNLVLNALQAQPGGGSVSVSVALASDTDSLGTVQPRVIVEVRDRGPGVAEKDREAIFEPFATTKSGTGGTGLGLAVVRGIVREHAGTIKLLDNPGGGAAFRVSLPRASDE